jgi:quercetin dioxygenase-like cupin family protein
MAAPRLWEALMADSTGEGFVLRPGQGRSLDLGTFAMSVKATVEQTRGHFSLLEATEPPGFGPPLHIHRDASESFDVLEGEYTVFLDQYQFTCPAGSFVFMPPGRPHSFRVGAETGRKLVLFTTASLVGYFEDLSKAIREDRVDPDVLSAIAADHSMEVLGPVPTGYL